MIKVIKRDGREKGFEFDRIETTVNNAYLEVYGDKVESFVHEIGDILNMIFKDISSKNDEAITIEEIQDIVVPNKRKYYIETLYSHYAHTHYAEHLDKTRKIIADKYPSYLNSFDTVINRTYGYMFNMMIMDKHLFNDYCSWLFDILFELQKRISTNDLSAFQGRFYGRVSEIIFNVWLDEKKKSGVLKKNEIKEIPYIHMED